jgi:hypothetical protein
MRKYLRAAAMMVGVMASGGAWADDDGDSDTTGTELPEAVAARVKSEFPSATIASTERHGGWWRASLVAGIRRQDVVFDPVGNVVERQEALAPKELPEALRASLERSHPRHTLWRATRITTPDGVFHEVVMTRGDRRSTVFFDPDGRVVAGATA